MENIEKLQSELLESIANTSVSTELEALRISVLGKKGKITQLMRDMGNLDPETRRATGQKLNSLKISINQAIESKKAIFQNDELQLSLKKERIDISLPTRPEKDGKIHPISQTIDEVTAILGSMGMKVKEGPNIEDDWHNFTALNIPLDHPARQEHDTFYFPGSHDKRKVLRTHTSPVQIRTMAKTKPPIRIIVPGRTYRCDYDATHSPMFHQIEGLWVDQNTHFGHLKGCLIDFCRAFFAIDDLPVRFRPSYFPFTEPSAEVDIGCLHENGEFRIGHGNDWLEILGCGMVNPKVLENCGINSQHFQGFAFGMGVERLAMLKYGIPDLRTFYESDIRWLNHYGFSALDIPSMVGGLTK